MQTSNVQTSGVRRCLVAGVCATGAFCRPLAAQAVQRVTIKVTATAGPVCPVERFPPDPTCASKPLSGLVVTATSFRGAVMGRGVTGRDGAAVVKVAPRATYVIRAWMPGQNGRPSLLPRCDQVVVKVQAALRAVTLHCDTGIR